MEVWRAELYHFGIKGMKWGVRRNRKSSKTKTNLSEHSSGKKYGKKAIAFVLTLAVGIAFAKIASNPKVISRVAKAMNKVGYKSMKDAADDSKKGSGIYSKILGRELTVEEAIERGFL